MTVRPQPLRCPSCDRLTPTVTPEGRCPVCERERRDTIEELHATLSANPRFRPHPPAPAAFDLPHGAAARAVAVPPPPQRTPLFPRKAVVEKLRALLDMAEVGDLRAFSLVGVVRGGTVHEREVGNDPDVRTVLLGAVAAEVAILTDEYRAARLEKP